jgi:hypothetical protein
VFEIDAGCTRTTRADSSWHIDLENEVRKFETLAEKENGIAAILNRDLLARLDEMDSGIHASSECWSSCKPLVRESFYWVAIAVTVWIVTVLGIR